MDASVWIAVAGLVVVILAQTIAIAWWASGITKMVHQHEDDIKRFRDMAGDAMESPAGRALAAEIAHIAARLNRLEEKGET